MNKCCSLIIRQVESYRSQEYQPSPITEELTMNQSLTAFVLVASEFALLSAVCPCLCGCIFTCSYMYVFNRLSDCLLMCSSVFRKVLFRIRKRKTGIFL